MLIIKPVLLNFLLIRESWKSLFPQKYLAAQLFTTLIRRRNVSWEPTLHMRMISEGWCNTSDWSNAALPSQEWIHILNTLK